MRKKTKIKLSHQEGYVLLTAIIFFLMAGSAIVFGVSNSVLREVKITNDLVRAKETYYLAEAGNEDVAYRVKNGMDVSSPETLTLGGNSVITELTDIAGGKLIISEGDLAGKIRRVESKLIAGVGVAFNYGVQVGTGGFELEENATVNGNVYSNGDIIGHNNSLITGSAVAASSAALLADQLNDSPATPPNSITFRNANSTQDFAQSFILGTAGQLSKVQFYIKKNGAPEDATVKIVSDNSGLPGTSVLASGTLNSSLVTENYGWVDVSVSSGPQLSAGATYWVVIDNSSDHSSKYYRIGGNANYANGQAKLGRLGGTWNNTSPSGLDGYFKIYTGGLTATITNARVGTGGVGDAWAHTVNDSTVAGSLYCAVGSGNNKACDTSKPDPTSQDMPISDGNIAEWKVQAEAGGVISGSYILSESSSLGPKKITGNLTVQNTKILTVTGTLWVVGNILVNDHSSIRLSSGYGENSGVVLADGTITTTNNSVLAGSGQTGSYLMLVSESSSPTAIKLDNNVQGGILYARNGTIDFENNAGAVQVSAYKIHLENNATINYESGLTHPTFSSGPSGGYNFSSWQEVE